MSPMIVFNYNKKRILLGMDGLIQGLLRPNKNMHGSGIPTDPVLNTSKCPTLNFLFHFQSPPVVFSELKSIKPIKKIVKNSKMVKIVK